jgi:hypothetical protein
MTIDVTRIAVASNKDRLANIQLGSRANRPAPVLG